MTAVLYDEDLDQTREGLLWTVACLRRSYEKRNAEWESASRLNSTYSEQIELLLAEVRDLEDTITVQREEIERLADMVVEAEAAKKDRPLQVGDRVRHDGGCAYSLASSGDEGDVMSVDGDHVSVDFGTRMQMIPLENVERI